MPDPVSLPTLFDGAEQAALRGDYAEAARLLGDAARLQESTLGTDAGELANTLNNLAVAHERSGDLDAAEREYRRAHEIAAASRAPDDPLVTTSAQNLREFCEANGRPLDRPAPIAVAAAMPAPATSVPLEADAATVVIARRDIPALLASPPPADSPTQPITPIAPIAPIPATARRERIAAAPAPAAARRLPVPLLVALGVLALLVIWFFAARRTSDAATEPEAAAADAVAGTAPATPPPAAAAPGPAPNTASPPARPAPSPTPPRAAAPAPARAEAGASVPITVDEARLCTALSAAYACSAAGDTVAPGRLTFYTRLTVPQDTQVVHRWYRGDELRQAVRLAVAARKQGYRTFSRGTVYVSEGQWRVELRTLDGRVLHTETFRVR